MVTLKCFCVYCGWRMCLIYLFLLRLCTCVLLLIGSARTKYYLNDVFFSTCGSDSFSVEYLHIAGLKHVPVAISDNTLADSCPNMQRYGPKHSEM